jgi:hypothetical protein
MTDDIRIDTESYERKHGKPLGRAFWTFKIISPSATYRDHVFTTKTPVTFHAVCQHARDLAVLRKSDHIVLLPGD